MRYQDAKQIPMSHLLVALGHQPAKQAGGEYWYVSPLRKEKDASFKLSRDEKAWYDHGLGQGGNILDFVMAYYHLSTVSQALGKLDGVAGYLAPPSTVTPAPSASASARPAEFELVTLKALHNRALIGYLRKRGITPQIAKHYCQEMHYTHDKKPYFSLAFANESGGFELRNPYFKGVQGTKDISIIRTNQPTTTVAVFEGFMDFLSAVVMTGRETPTYPVIILNSATMKERALKQIRDWGATIVHCYLDRDETGRELTAWFQEQFADVMVHDQSGLYEGYKDFNDYLQKHQQMERC